MNIPREDDAVAANLKIWSFYRFETIETQKLMRKGQLAVISIR